MRKFLKHFLIFALILAIGGVAVPAYAAPRAQSAVLQDAVALIDLATTNQIQLVASVLPAEASQRLKWKSSNTSIATVSQTGLVTAKRTGKVYIYVQPYSVSRTSRCALTITDSLAPTSLVIPATSYNLRVGDTMTLSATPMPETAVQDISWKSTSTSVATITQDGVVTARRAGTTTIRVRSLRATDINRSIKITVTKVPAPKRILITPDTKDVNIGSTLQLTASPEPVTSAQGVRWSSSNNNIATVSPTGLVTLKAAGTVKITVTSTASSSVKTVRTLTVYDPYTPRGIQIGGEDLFMIPGQTHPLTATVTPSTATGTVMWSSSSSAVSVDSDGNIQANSSGAAVITATIGKFSSKINVAVIDTNYATIAPARSTEVSGMAANLTKIDNIHNSVHQDIALHVTTGQLSAASASARKAAIDEAFKMYRFPWMTKTLQRYWSTTAPSKSYQPNIIYYGMPYLQHGLNGNDQNRRFNLDRALSGDYFRKTGDYYTMNQDRKLNGMYVGNDCSSYLSMSIWGTGHAASFLRTRDMSRSSYYRTVQGGDKMLPGDTLVKAGSHTVMFLYYTNSAKTHMMIIEQGGGAEPNTIACRHKSVSAYLTSGYIIRRPVKYGS